MYTFQKYLIEKVNDTEKLAGIIIKIPKGIGNIFLILLVIDIISFIVFFAIRNETSEQITEEYTISCYLNETNYLITIRSDKYFNCSNCSKDIQNNIKDLIDYSNVDTTIEDIERYFSNDDGYCE